MTLLYVFLIKRPIDREAWPVVFRDATLADTCPYRVSDVYQVTAVEKEPVNVPGSK